jgi:hypothetical protein
VNSDSTTKDATQYGTWLAESLRFTAFTASPHQPSDLFRELTGNDPEEEVRRAPLGILQEQGAYGGNRLVLVQDRTHIDLLLAMAPNSPELGRHGFVTVGNYEEAISSFESVVSDWLDAAPEVNRIALGVILLLPFETDREAYAALQSMIAIEFDPVTDSDVTWQINRPRRSEADPGLMLNRLSNWSVVKLVTFQLAEAAPRPSGQSVSLLRLQLDINTPGGRSDPLDKPRLFPLWKEFRALGAEIAKSGDIK